jgi:hypothetical protein
MYSYLIVSGLFLILTGICKAVSDKLQFHFHESVFRNLNQMWWNPELSWQNKWEQGDPKFGPRFWLSTTVLVFVTDAWHFFNWLRNRCLDISYFCILILLFKWWICLLFIIGIAILKACVFQIFFSKIFKV